MVSWPDASVRSVIVWLGGGDVAILAAADGEPARVEVHEVTGPPLAVSCVDETLRVEHREPAESVWSTLRRVASTLSMPTARLAIVVPPEAEVTVRVASAAVYVEGLTGQCRLTSLTGSVTLDRLSGTVVASTGAGAVRGSRLSGHLRVKTVTGPVAVRRSTLGSARLATVSGRVDLELLEPNCLLTSATATGALEIRVPPGTGYDLTAHAPADAVRIDDATIGPPDEPHDARQDAARARREEPADGVHRADGDRSLVIKARSRSGTVTLRRDL